jgi:hypothetical protein
VRSANPEKTKFMMFGRGQEEPITVGDAQVSESTEDVLLGITFNKSVSCKSHLYKLESELRKRGTKQAIPEHAKNALICHEHESLLKLK